MPRLPVDQFRRIERAALHIEGYTTAPEMDDGRGDLPIDQRVMLLQGINPRLNQGDTKSVKAVILQYTTELVYLLRVGKDDPREFKLKWNGQKTSPLTVDSTAAEVQSALEAIPELGGKVAVIGPGMEIDSANPIVWTHPAWFILVSPELNGSIEFEVDDEGNFPATLLTMTSDLPLDHVVDIFPRFAGDEQNYAGDIVTARSSPGLGLRIWSASLKRPEPCPPVNAQIRLFIGGPPTGGTWGLTILAPFEDPETETSETRSYLIEDLQWDCTAEDVQEKIDAVEDLVDNVVVTGGNADDSAFNLEFVERLGKQPIPLPFLHWGNLEGVMLGGDAKYHVIGRAAEVD